MKVQEVRLQNEIRRAVHLLDRGKTDEASNLVSALLKKVPDNIHVRVLWSDIAAGSGNTEEAATCVADLYECSSLNASVAVRLARVKYAIGRRAECLNIARQGGSRYADDPLALKSFASLLRDCSKHDEAYALVLRARELAPGMVGLLYDEAILQYGLNMPDQAESNLNVLLQHAPHHWPAIHLRSALRTWSRDCNHVDDLRQRFASGFSDPRFVAATCYALGKELEDLGEYAEATLNFDRGARAYRGALSYDAAREIASHDAIRHKFTEDVFRSLGKGYEEECPIFIVGMPRTGTTLVERILAKHSKVASLGEFTEYPRLYSERLRKSFNSGSFASPTEASLSLDFCELGGAYARVMREMGNGSPVVVDKLPYNYLYCGYILASLPNARIVHMVRDPLDTCYAVYKTLFFGAYQFSYDIGELADYYLSYRRLMDHWHTVAPGRILDVSYDTFVTEPEAQARRLIEWCGLSWEPSVMEYHDLAQPSMTASAMQVRRPIYTQSVGSWRRAEDILLPAKIKFEEEGIYPQESGCATDVHRDL